MRKGFIIKGKDTWHAKDILTKGDIKFRWVPELKAYAYLSGVCNHSITETIKKWFQYVLIRYEDLTLYEVDGSELLCYFPKEQALENEAPYKIATMLCGTAMHDDPFQNTFHVGKRIYLFQLSFEDVWLVHATKEEIFSNPKIKEQHGRFLPKLKWFKEQKVWVTDSEIVKEMLEEKLIKKYETYLMDLALREAFKEE